MRSLNVDKRRTTIKGLVVESKYEVRSTNTVVRNECLGGRTGLDAGGMRC